MHNTRHSNIVNCVIALHVTSIPLIASELTILQNAFLSENMI